MDANDELYDKAAAGTANPVELEARVGAIKRRILAEAEGTDAQREKALVVASSLPSEDRSAVLTSLLDSAHAGFRQDVLDKALSLREDGLRVLRSGLGSAHPEIALTCLQTLTRGVDKTSTRRVQGLLGSEHAVLRAAAIRFLGHAGGPALLPQVAGLLTDPDDTVAAAAEVAAERLRGERPRRSPMNWWEAPELEAEFIAEDSLSSLPEPAPVVPPSDVLPPPRADEAHALEELASLSSLVPAGTTGSAQHGGGWEPERPAALPSELPVETLALAKLLSRIAAADRVTVLEPLRSCSDLRTAVDSLSRSKAEVDRVAAALAIEGCALRERLALATRMLRDQALAVRCAAAATVGALGGPSALAQLSRLLRDPEIEVQRAGVLALAGAAARLGQHGFARSAIAGMAEHPALDDSIAQAQAILGPS